MNKCESITYAIAKALISEFVLGNSDKIADRMTNELTAFLPYPEQLFFL